MDNIDERRKQRKGKETTTSDDKHTRSTQGEPHLEDGHKKRRRKFRQTEPVTQGNDGSVKAPLLGAMI